MSYVMAGSKTPQGAIHHFDGLAHEALVRQLFLRIHFEVSMICRPALAGLVVFLWDSTSPKRVLSLHGPNYSVRWC
jgi:hypothetical protein